MVVFLRARRREMMLDYSLVLHSQQIDHEVDTIHGRYLLSVPRHRLSEAREALHAYVRENRDYFKEQPAPPLHILLSPLFYLAWPLVFHFGVLLSAWPHAIKKQGAADAERILSGEWWRTLTATTLHADHPHFLSNLFAGYFLLNLLAHRIGMGTILFAGVLCSMAANYLVALTSGLRHVSVGFSTTVFAVLGMLAGVETLLRPKVPGSRFRRLLPLMAAFAVAVLVGIGDGIESRIDVKAHFFGFGMGAAAGLVTRWLPQDAEKPLAQVGLGLFGYLAYAVCWGIALGWLRF
jgi:rhomboid protease GluP